MGDIFSIKSRLKRLIYTTTRAAIKEEFLSIRKDIQEELSHISRQLDITQNELHSHIDWTQRDILIVLQRALQASPQPSIRCITDYPVAYDSPDYIHPIGTLNDHTRCPRFIKACERLFPHKKRLSFLDLGCSAGGIVWDAVLGGHIGIGLEGSNISLLQQRAEWRLLPDNLFTCDISKPFALVDEHNKPWQFDVVSAWEVLEHLTEDGLHMLFKNLTQIMKPESFFFCSVSLIDGGTTDDGLPLHQTIQPYEWWKEFIYNNGFKVVNPLPIKREDFARGNGHSSIYYRENTSYRENPGDCILFALQRK